MSFVLLLFAVAGLAQTTGNPAVPRSFPIDSIAIEGNRILSHAAILNASGLRKGETGNTALFDAARDRLLATGYFETVGYRYKPSTTAGYDVVYEVQEVATLYPIRVDALPPTTAEVTAWLKEKDPLFTGKMPGTKQVLDRTAREIEQYLETRNQPAQVAGRVIAVAAGQLEIDFTPSRGLPVIADVIFEGSKVISAIDLRNKIAEVAVGQPYTESGFRMLLDNQIRALYEAKGYMRVAFPVITTAPSTHVQGLELKVSVDEGAQYKLARVIVGGAMASDSARILKTAKLPQMTVANFDQVKDGALRVRDSMRHQGYLDAQVTTARTLDDEKKTVEFALVVETGPEYKQGKLTVNGLGLDGEAAVRKMWSVKEGDPFPDGYPDVFIAGVKEEGIFDNLGDMKARTNIDRSSHTVDVTLDFKGTPPKERAPRRPGDFPVQH